MTKPKKLKTSLSVCPNLDDAAKTQATDSSILHSNPTQDLLSLASGPVTIRMTNDYLFRALLQTNNKVLKGFLSSLLHLPVKEIYSVEIQNPIVLGKAITDKEFFLDILLVLNNHTIINLEMQVINEHNWPDRSLCYLCRAFDTLNKGELYTQVKPIIHIGILDFTLFPDLPEFYATYKLLNIKNHSKYSDKLCISVLDLTQIHLATKEDKLFKIDHWAALFQSTTWEEIKMLAKENDYIKEASDTIFQLTQEEAIRWQCQAREDFIRSQRSMEHLIEMERKRAEKATEQAEKATERAEKAEAHISELEKQLQEALLLLSSKEQESSKHTNIT